MNCRLILLCATAILVACTPAATEPAIVEIRGTASYHERMLLPPGSTLEVTLEDVSRADAPAEVIARTEMPVSAAPPFRFTLAFDPARIVADHRYHVRARVSAADKVLFRSRMGSPVLGPGNILRADVTMRRESAEVLNNVIPPQRLRGLYSYMADAAWFVDCLSGVRLPVTQQADNLALETAYMKSRPMPGAQMLVSLEGRVEYLMPMEGSQERLTLIVDKFISIEAQGCSGPSSTAQLENTYWKFTTLYDKSVESPEGAREIHFVLNRESFRLSGFSGCNRLTGSYRLDGEMLSFNNIATTEMACPYGMDIEHRVHEMFPMVAGWKISGETLQLTDSNGTPIATFESVYLR